MGFTRTSLKSLTLYLWFPPLYILLLLGHRKIALDPCYHLLNCATILRSLWIIGRSLLQCTKLGLWSLLPILMLQAPRLTATNQIFFMWNIILLFYLLCPGISYNLNSHATDSILMQFSSIFVFPKSSQEEVSSKYIWLLLLRVPTDCLL